MKAPSLDGFYLGDLCTAARAVSTTAPASIGQVERWIQLRHFVPNRKTDRGVSRRYDETDAIRLAVIVAAAGFGLDLSIAASISEELREKGREYVNGLIKGDVDCFAIVSEKPSRRVWNVLFERGIERALAALNPPGTELTSFVWVVINLSDIARRTSVALREHLVRTAATEAIYKAAGGGSYDDVEE